MLLLFLYIYSITSINKYIYIHYIRLMGSTIIYSKCIMPYKNIINAI